MTRFFVNVASIPRTPVVLLAGLVGLVSLGSLSCDRFYEPGESKSYTPGQPDLPQGAGVGQACSETDDCRPGLECATESHTCQPGHSLPSGSTCVISGECSQGLYCNEARVCAEAGSGQAGDVCQTDGDCSPGLKCSLRGFSTACQPEGPGDVGADCTSTADCLGGLGCIEGMCGQVPQGMPPFGIPTWQGETCSDDTSGPVKAYFRVPRGNDEDGDFYRLPFPNDVRLKNGHPDLSGHPTPGAQLLGFDPLDRYLRSLEKYNDGWGVYPTVVFRFSGAIDFASFHGDDHPKTIQWYDITKGATEYGWKRGWYAVASTARTKYMCSNWLAIRPPEGEPLLPDHTYAVILSTDARTTDGKPIIRDVDFDAMLADTPPQEAALTGAYQRYEPLRSFLKDQSIDPGSVLDAAVFTVGHVQSPVQGLRKAIDALPPPKVSNWVSCTNGTSPCPQAEGDRGCGKPDPDFEELQALVELPIFQDGKIPYLDPEDGGGFVYDQDGVPKVVETQKVCLSLTIPKGAAMPEQGWPLVVYAHGTGGSYRSHILEGVAKRLSSVQLGDETVHFAVLGIDQVQHGPRRGSSTQSPENLFFNFANPLAARYNVLQGAADQMSLFALAPTLALDASHSPTGKAWKIDGHSLVFWGHSQGATEGAIAMPFVSNVRGVVLSGNGASLRDSLLSKTQPVNVAAALPFVLLDPDSQGKLAAGELNPALSLLQMWIDPADPLAYASTMTRRPVEGLGPHHVFQPFGRDDHFSPTLTQVTYAIAAGLQYAPDGPGVSASVDELLSLQPATSGSANVQVGDTAITALLKRYEPDGYDGHFVSFRNERAKRDIDAFLARSISDQAPSVEP